MLAIWRVWKSSKHCSGVNDMAEQHEKALVPQIRFTGFTDPWEQRKLGELTESYSGGTPAAGESEFYGGSIPFIRSAEIAAESTELFLTEKGYESSSARMVNPAMCCMHCTERQVARWLYRGKKVPSTKLFSPYSLATIVMQDTSLLG